MNNTLSKRESEILELISREMSSEEIADKLFISTNTVKSHRRSLLIKMHAKNTAGLVRKGFEIGVL